MRRRTQKTTPWQRLGALALALVMLVGILPAETVSAAGTTAGVAGVVTTEADPSTIRRPADIYGDHTENAGKVTVGKSVADHTETVSLEGGYNFTAGEDNFIVTVSQTAQVVSEISESPVPLDVVFVLDTSGSMDNRAASMVTAANAAISTLMSANENNRVAVVAFSSSGQYGGGTSGGAAANVLSSLAHYDGDAATNHLQWVNSSGSTTGNG